MPKLRPLDLAALRFGGAGLISLEPSSLRS
jgi:hypothetical protein